MNCRHVALCSIGGLALIACSAVTTGLGDSGSAAESETETDAGSESDDNSEASEAEAGTDAPGDGDGDPTTDSESEDESPTGDEESSTCGDGVVDPGEDCDGSDLDGMDCVALGFVAGQLACSPGCSFDTAACVDAVCGNGMIEGSEECDGRNLDGVDCVALGFGAGKPNCTNSCTFDTSVCPTAGEGESCGLFDECPGGLVCVGGKCYDGSLNDPCNWNSDCQDGLSCQPWGDGNCKP